MSGGEGAQKVSKKCLAFDVRSGVKNAPYPGEEVIHRGGATMQRNVPAPTAEQVADLLATVAAANGLFAGEADWISSSRATVSLAALDRLSKLAAELRPGAEARAVLSDLDPDLPLAGTSVWLARNRTPAAERSATDRAAARWSGPGRQAGDRHEVG